MRPGVASLERSLRAALARWFVLAAAFGVLALGGGIVAFGGAHDAEDDDLAAAARRTVVALGPEPESVSGAALRAALPGDLPGNFCALRRSDGALLAGWNVRAPEGLPPLGAARSAAAFERMDAERARALTGEDGAVRVVTLPFRAGERTYFLQLGARGGRWSPTRAAGLVLFVLGALALAFAARFAAHRLAGRVLTPLCALIEEARGLSPSRPGARFRLPGEHRELRRLEEELNGALQRLEEGSRSQAHFASDVAHELRTPIAALMADVQVSRLARASPEESLAFLERAEGELRHLAELVESFLVMAQVEAREPEQRNDLVYLDDVVRRASSRCAPAAGRGGVALELRLAPGEECAAFVRGDGQLLQAMLENLLRNAIHHSPRGERVTVSTDCSEESLRITVADRGPGIPAEFHESVFVRGFRAPSQVRDSGGAGLGLAIVSNVARLHGGHVALESGASGGCRFTVTLPLARGARAVSAS